VKEKSKMHNTIQVLEINSSNDLALAVKKFPFLSGLYTDNGIRSNGDAILPNDPWFLSIEQEQKVIDTGLGQWVKVLHFNDNEISARYDIAIDDSSDPDGCALDRIEAAVEGEGFRYAHFVSTGDWCLVV
jgi:hypothetical protein